VLIGCHPTGTEGLIGNGLKAHKEGKPEVTDLTRVEGRAGAMPKKGEKAGREKREKKKKP